MLPSLVAVVLVLLGALHVYWGAGGRWPGHDGASLAALVGGTRGPMHGPGPCAAVAVLLTIAAVLVLGAGGVLALPLPGLLVTVGAWGVVVVLAARGIGGFLESRFRPSIIGLPYERWSKVLYSPLCLGIAGLAALAIS